MSDEKKSEEHEDKLVKHLSRIIDNLNQHWHSIQLLLGAVSKPLIIDDRGLSQVLSRFTELINKFNSEQVYSEIKYIGSRLSTIEEEIKKIRIGGVKKSVDLQIQVDGYEMIKKPLNHDKTEPIEKSLSELLEPALKSLTPLEIDVLKLRFGLFGEKAKTLVGAGKILGKSRERVR